MPRASSQYRLLLVHVRRIRWLGCLRPYRLRSLSSQTWWHAQRWAIHVPSLENQQVCGPIYLYGCLFCLDRWIGNWHSLIGLGVWCRHLDNQWTLKIHSTAYKTCRSKYIQWARDFCQNHDYDLGAARRWIITIGGLANSDWWGFGNYLICIYLGGSSDWIRNNHEMLKAWATYSPLWLETPW